MSQTKTLIAEIWAITIIDGVPKIGGRITNISIHGKGCVQVESFVLDQVIQNSVLRVLHECAFEQKAMEEAWDVLCVILTFLYRPSAIYCATREQLAIEYGINPVDSLLMTSDRKLLEH